MSTSRQTVQSAPERRSAEAELRALIAKHASAHGRLIGAVRRRLRERLPAAHELVYEYRSWLVISFSPSEHGYEGVLAVRADVDGVKLYINRGKGLPDPEKLLQGSGGQARWIGLDSAAKLARPAVVELIDGAIARNPVPFERNGRGSVVHRSARSKKRVARRPA